MNNSTKQNRIMYKTLLLITLVIVAAVFTNSAYAMNYTSSIFSNAQRYADSNSYKNSEYGFSIQPPLNWGIASVPANISNGTIVIFTNGDKSQLSTFGIQHSFISQNITRSIINHSDNDIFSIVARTINSNSSDSSTSVLNGLVDRYSDGVRVAVSYTTHYTADDSTILSENVYYFLDNGNQYILEMASNPTNIQKNAQLFADSAETFLVNQPSAVPEFPIVPVALTVGMALIIASTRVGLFTRLGHSN
jgi:hypothetical protein